MEDNCVIVHSYLLRYKNLAWHPLIRASGTNRTQNTGIVHTSIQGYRYEMQGFFQEGWMGVVREASLHPAYTGILRLFYLPCGLPPDTACSGDQMDENTSGY